MQKGALRKPSWRTSFVLWIFCYCFSFIFETGFPCGVEAGLDLVSNPPAKCIFFVYLQDLELRNRQAILDLDIDLNIIYYNAPVFRGERNGTDRMSVSLEEKRCPWDSWARIWVLDHCGWTHQVVRVFSLLQFIVSHEVEAKLKFTETLLKVPLLFCLGQSSLIFYTKNFSSFHLSQSHHLSSLNHMTTWALVPLLVGWYWWAQKKTEWCMLLVS